MIHATMLVLVVGGFAMLCAARERHQRDLFGRTLPPARARWLRAAGWGLIGLALLVAMSAGWARGTLLWAGYLSIGALVSVGVLNRATTRRQKRR